MHGTIKGVYPRKREVGHVLAFLAVKGMLRKQLGSIGMQILVDGLSALCLVCFI
jgi:hypothetical protein